MPEQIQAWIQRPETEEHSTSQQRPDRARGHRPRQAAHQEWAGTHSSTPEHLTHWWTEALTTGREGDGGNRSHIWILGCLWGNYNTQPDRLMKPYTKRRKNKHCTHTYIPQTHFNVQVTTILLRGNRPLEPEGSAPSFKDSTSRLLTTPQ